MRNLLFRGANSSSQTRRVSDDATLLLCLDTPLTNEIAPLSALDLAPRQLHYHGLLAGNLSLGAIMAMMVDVSLDRTLASTLALFTTSTT